MYEVVSTFKPGHILVEKVNYTYNNDLQENIEIRDVKSKWFVNFRNL